MAGTGAHQFYLIENLPKHNALQSSINIWTFGYLHDVDTTNDLVVLEYDKGFVEIKTTLLDPIKYDKGSLFMCLGCQEGDRQLFAKVLRQCDEIDIELFLKAKKTNS